MNRCNLSFLVLVTFFFLCRLPISYAQKTIIGNIQDSSNQKISGISVQLISNKDTIYSKSEENGKFAFKDVQVNKFSLSISSLLYKIPTLNLTFQKGQTVMRLKPIILEKIITQLKEVQIKDKVTAVVFKKDTVEYNALAYPVEKYARVKEILKHLPGLHVDDEGNLTFEGESITKLRVNGKDFFSGNVTEFITQLPAEIISKLQIINDYGDQANYTGVKNGGSQKMLNLVTKANINSGRFGGITLNSGTDKRYGTSFSGNHWKDTKQVSINTSLNKANNASGIITNNFLRLNYRNNWRGGKIVFSGGIDYQRTHNNFGTTSSSETLNSLGIIYNNSLNSTEGNKNSYSLNSNVQYRPDNFNFITTSISVQNFNEKRTTNTGGIQSGIIHQSNNTNNQSFSSSPISNGSFSLNHRFKKIGRTISANLIVNNDHNLNSQNISDRTGYFSDTNVLLKDSLFHRVVNTNNTSFSSSVNLEYTEPIKNNISLNPFYKFERARGNNNLLTNLIRRNNDIYKIDSLSSIYHTTFTTNTAGVNYYYTKGRLYSQVNVAIQQNIQETIYDDKSYSIFKSYLNFIPTVTFEYNRSSKKSFGFRYSTNTLYPSLDQLSPIKDLHNLQNSIVGNPYLSPAITHLAGFNYRIVNPNTNAIFMLKLNGSIIQNPIVTNTFLIRDTLNSLKQETHYMNVNDSYNIGGSYNYVFPVFIIKALKVNTSSAGVVNYNNGEIYINNYKELTTRINFNQQIRLWTTTKNFGFDGTADYIYNYNNYSINLTNIKHVEILQFKGSGWINILKSSKINFDVNKNFYKGYQSLLTGNPLIINTSVEQRLFKKYGGGLRLTLTDLLNQANSIQRAIVGNAIIDTKTNFVTRYILLTFNIQIDRFQHNN